MAVDNQLYNRPGDIWWDEREPLSTLRTMLNPVRFGFFRSVLMDQVRIDPIGRAALDVGCGGGLLAEEFARLGFLVSGIDPSHSSLVTARKHAACSGLAINYVAGRGESLPFAAESYDIVLCCDVLEHVDGPEQLIAEMARVLKQDGVFLCDTINRTWRSKIAIIKLFQEWSWTRCAPANLHDWNKFIQPRELGAMMARHGLQHRATLGMQPHGNPLRIVRHLRECNSGRISCGELGRRLKMRASRNLSMSYMLWAVKRRQPIS